MTKLAPAKDWRNRPLEKWNTTTFHAYLAHLNEERRGVTYEPFGGGSVGNRWRIEKGQLKQAIDKHGAPVIKRYIDICFIRAKVNPRYPCLAWGFMWAYMRAELTEAQAETKAQASAGAEPEFKAEDSILDWL